MSYPPSKKTNICFSCQKACGKCSWSRNFTPVPGWTAKKVMLKVSNYYKKRIIETYHITACPEYVPDPPRKSNNLELSEFEFLRMKGRLRFND